MIKIAIVGTGNISRMHIEAYQAFPMRCEIVALVDIYPEKAKKRKEAFGLDKAKIYNSHKDMLQKADVDLVSICTPPYCHAEITIDCLNNGAHVLVEKPMASSLEECDHMLEAAARNGKILSVVAQNRFRDPVMKLKKILDSGMIGRVLHAQVDSFWWRGHSYYDLWWRGTWEKEGGGCTLNHAVHHIDMLCWMMGSPITITAVLSNAGHDNSEVEDISAAILQYSQGSLAQITSSLIHHGEEQQLVFQGEKARISAPWKVAANVSMGNGFPKAEQDETLMQQLNSFYATIPDLPYIAHDGQIDDVLSSIKNDRPPLITGEDGRRTIELITAIYKAHTEKKAVVLPIIKDDVFYTVKGIMEHAPRFFEKQAYVEELEGDITFGNDYKNSYK